MTSYLKCHVQVTNDKCREKAILSFSGEDAIENDGVVYLETIDESAIKQNWEKKEFFLIHWFHVKSEEHKSS